MLENLYNLTGQKVLIIGGGSRMGLAVARLAIALGAEVIISSRSAQKLEQAAATISDRVRTYAADASDIEATEQMLKALAPMDHIVVTASGSASATGIVDTPPHIARVAFSRFWLSYNVLHSAPGQVRPSGSITLLSGSSGRRPVAGYGVWGTLHGSIEALAKSATLELAPIRVNVISPGGIGLQPDHQLVHRAGQPEDVAGMAIAVMINPAMTGATIDVDSGERLGKWSGDDETE
jgi:NAD(P)-dependent dehydrogenase (short-subunit alcohol dehydrogenase family)